MGINLFTGRPFLVVQVYITYPQGPQASRLEPPVPMRKDRRSNAKTTCSSLHFGNDRHIMWFRMPCHIWWPVVVAVMTIWDMDIKHTQRLSHGFVHCPGWSRSFTPWSYYDVWGNKQIKPTGGTGLSTIPQQAGYR